MLWPIPAYVIKNNHRQNESTLAIIRCTAVCEQIIGPLIRQRWSKSKASGSWPGQRSNLKSLCHVDGAQSQCWPHVKKVPPVSFFDPFENHRGHILSVWCQVHHSASSYYATVVTAILRSVCLMRGNGVRLQPQAASCRDRSTDPDITPDAASLISLSIPDGGSCSPTPGTTPLCAPQSWVELPDCAASSANATSKWSPCPSTAWRITTAGPRCGSYNIWHHIWSNTQSWYQ